MAGDVVIAGQLREQTDHCAAAAWGSDEERVRNGFPAKKSGFELMPDACGGLTGAVLADHRLPGRSEGGERGQHDHGGDDPAEGTEREAAGPSDQHKDCDCAEGQRAGLVEAAGATAAQLALERAQDAAASSDYENAETCAEKQESDCPPGRKLGLIEGGDQGNGGGGGRKQEPGAAAHPEVGERTPKEIDGMRKGQKRGDACGAGGVDALVAQEISDSAADEAE